MKTVITIDPAATSDRAAIVAATIYASPTQRLQVARLVALEPPIAPDDILGAASEVAARDLNHQPPVVVVDVAGSLGIVAALANRFGARNVMGLRITAAFEHALAPEPLILSRTPALAVPCWHVSRSRLLDDLRRAAGNAAIALPTKDETQRAVLQELKREMQGIAETVTPAGRVLGVADGRDDLVMSLAYGVWALGGPVGVMAARDRSRWGQRSAPSPLAWT